MESKHGLDLSSPHGGISQASSSRRSLQPEHFTGQPSQRSEEGQIMTLVIEENVPEAIETFTRLSVLGHFAKATIFFDDVLRRHLGLLPVFAEYTNSLIQQGRYDVLLECVKDRKAAQVHAQPEEQEIEYLDLLQTLSVLHVEGRLVETLEALEARSASYSSWLSMPIDELSGMRIRSIEMYIDIVAALISIMPPKAIQVARNITLTLPRGKSFTIFGNNFSVKSIDPWIQLQSWCLSLQENHPLEAQNVFRTLLDVVPERYMTVDWITQSIQGYSKSRPFVPLTRLAADKAKNAVILSAYRRNDYPNQNFQTISIKVDESIRRDSRSQHYLAVCLLYLQEKGVSYEENIFQNDPIGLNAQLDLGTIAAIAREEANYRLESTCIERMINVDLSRFNLWLAVIALTSNDSNTAYHHLIHSAIELVKCLGRSKSRTVLHNAVSIGSLAGLRLMIERGEEIEERDDNGMTALHLAASKGHTAAAQMLLSHNSAPLSWSDFFGRLPLHIAVQNGHDALVQLLMESDGAFVDAAVKDGGRGLLHSKSAPLHLAAAHGHEQVVSTLLRYGANVEKRDSTGGRPLHRACVAWQYGVAFLLLRHGANVNSVTRNNETPLILAARNGHGALIELLLSFDADVHIQGDFEQTALHFAAESGDQDSVKLLLEHGSDILTASRFGETVLHFAAKGGHTNVVKFLLSNEAKVEVDSKERHGETPLSLAAWNGYKATVQILLDKGAAIETRSKRGDTPLSRAASNGHEAVVRTLLENGADKKAVNSSQLTPLDLAERGGHQAVARLLL